MRKLNHPQVRDSFHVVIKVDGDEIEVGSIGVRHGSAQRKDGSGASTRLSRCGMLKRKAPARIVKIA